MTANQYRATLRRLALTQSAAARLVSADDRTGRRWALGERKVPECVAILLKLLVYEKITVADIESVR